ncbi:SGNH/GDSL hydrolase family protein [Saccharothrix obliqua]|uniref:SGNH/GDSL hydrolase family protein n=1 Tax=Saccharothrix obliqua TaxID=2861747 RepID=UPI001C5E6B2E|nr:SGNH/GDSL hydrolase family protein [Saccharothrix obliqua]MBW4721317.1 SGNH/GDSL hydrolase family protein [Saccharothrix obliqua]
MRDLTRRLVAGLSVVCAASAAWAVPSATATAQEELRWAALGDSYTAGVFIGAPTPPLGSADRDGCDRTANSYPDLVNRELAEFPPGKPVRLTDVGCGGAEIRHIAKDRQRPVSPVDPPAAGWPEVDTQVKRAGLDGETDVVTIGVGGNSLPFTGMLATCVQHGSAPRTCQEHYENPPDGEEGIDAKLARVQDEYIGMLVEVHQAAPKAKVITVGYPAVLPENAADCTLGDWTKLLTIRHSDVDWLRGVLDRLNQTIKTVTDFFGDRYVDVHSSSVGHDACQAAESKWVEGICGDAEDFWPTELTIPGGMAVPCPAGKHATLVHPNARGHANTALHVERAIRIALLES